MGTHGVAETPDAPTFLPLPTSVVGRRVADLAFADHRGERDLHVSAGAGFASTAAFSFAFRQVATMTPTTFLDRHREA